MEHFEVGRAILLVLAGVLFIFTLFALKRAKNKRLVFATVVFGIFLVKGMLLTFAMFNGDLENIIETLWFHLTFDIVVLLFLFFSIMRTPGEVRVDIEKKDGKGKIAKKATKKG